MMFMPYFIINHILKIPDHTIPCLYLASFFWTNFAKSNNSVGGSPLKSNNSLETANERRAANKSSLVLESCFQQLLPKFFRQANFFIIVQGMN